MFVLLGLAPPFCCEPPPPCELLLPPPPCELAAPPVLVALGLAPPLELLPEPPEPCAPVTPVAPVAPLAAPAGWALLAQSGRPRLVAWELVLIACTCCWKTWASEPLPACNAVTSWAVRAALRTRPEIHVVNACCCADGGVRSLSCAIAAFSIGSACCTSVVAVLTSPFAAGSASIWLSALAQI